MRKKWVLLLLLLSSALTLGAPTPIVSPPVPIPSRPGSKSPLEGVRDPGPLKLVTKRNVQEEEEEVEARMSFAPLPMVWALVLYILNIYLNWASQNLTFINCSVVFCVWKLISKKSANSLNRIVDAIRSSFDRAGVGDSDVKVKANLNCIL